MRRPLQLHESQRFLQSFLPEKPGYHLVFGCDLCQNTKSIWKLVHLAGCLSLGLGSLLNVLNVTSLITKEKPPVLRNLEQKSQRQWVIRCKEKNQFFLVMSSQSPLFPQFCSVQAELPLPGEAGTMPFSTSIPSICDVNQLHWEESCWKCFLNFHLISLHFEANTFL